MGTDDTNTRPMLSDDQFNQIKSWFEGLEQRLTSLEDKVDKRFMNTQPLRELITEEIEGLKSKVDGLEAKLEARIDGLEAKLESKVDGLEAKLEARVDGLEARVDALEAKLDARVDALEAKLEARVDGIETKIDRMNENIADKIEVLNDNILEATAKSKRFQRRLNDLEQKAS